jgi:hypothetical protein
MKPKSLVRWRADLKAAAEKLPMEAITRLQRILVLMAWGAAITMPGGGSARLIGIVPMTPIDNGPARASWRVSVGSKPSGEGSKSPDLAGLQPGQIVWISSRLPYILTLEYGGYPDPPTSGSGKTVGGYSTQAPQGMVRVTFEELKQVVSQIGADAAGPAGAPA